MPTAFTDAALLDALLLLLQTKTSALAIVERTTEATRGYVTLASINQAITSSHVSEGTQTQAEATR
jgi:hypothetical protein